jgi:elongation factor P
MLSISEIKLGKVIKVNDQPYVITKADHHKMARGGAVLKTKLKNLIDSSVLEKTFQGNDKAEEADVEKKKVNYMYSDENKAYFMDNESYDQFELSLDVIGDKTKFMKDGTDVDVLYFQDKPVAVELPIKMDFAVTEAPPGVKGDSASNVTKQITIETGAKLNAPLFINEGDRIRVNTDTGEYVERAK